MLCISRTLCGVGSPQTPSQSSFCYVSETCYVFFKHVFFLSMPEFVYFLQACLWESVLPFVYFHCIFLRSLSVILIISALLVTNKQTAKRWLWPPFRRQLFQGEMQRLDCVLAFRFNGSVILGDLKWNLLKEWNFSETHHQSSPCK